jgi:centriolar protein POC1
MDKTEQPAGDPALKRSFKGHKDQVCKVAFNPNLKQVVSGSVDGTVMVWNFKSTMRPYRFVGHKEAVYDVKVSPTGNIIASCSADRTIRLWNNSVEGHSKVIKSHQYPVRCLSISQNG